MIKSVDYCTNSITFSLVEKQFINSKLNKLFNNIRQAVIDKQLRVNIYLGGSLALGEPSLNFIEGKPYSLNSDADMYAVIDDIKQSALVIQLFDTLANIEPELERSLHITPLVKIPSNHYLCSIDDLLYAINQPIIKTFSVEEFLPSLDRDPKSMAMLFVGSICCAILPYYISSNIYSNINNYHQFSQKLVLKMILNGLRLQLYGTTIGAHGIKSVYQALSTDIFNHIMPDNMIYQILVMRERYQEDIVLPEFDIYQFILNSWQNKLDLVHTPDVIVTLDSVCKYFFNNQYDLCDMLAVIILGYSLYFIKPNSQLASYILSKINLLYLSGNMTEKLNDIFEESKRVINNKSALSSELAKPLIELHHIFLTLQTQKIYTAHIRN